MSFPQPIYPCYSPSGAITPLSISGCQIWFDASDLSTMKQENTGASATTAASVGNPVGSWLNKGALGGWATSPNNTTSRPTLGQDGGGNYYLSFDGSLTYFTLAGSSQFSTNQATQIFRAFNRTASGVYSVGLGDSTGVAYDSYWWNNNHQYDDDNETGVSDTSTGAFVYNTYRPGVNLSGSTLFRNGSSLIGSSATFASARTAVFIANVGGVITTGYIYQSGVWFRALNSTEIAQMTTFFGSKCGLTL